MLLPHRPIPKAVRERAERQARRDDPNCTMPSSNYSACPFCGAARCHYAGPRDNGVKERCMFLYWGEPCEDCKDIRRRSPDIFDWVCQTLAFVLTPPDKDDE